jgi:hypothetical protein
MKIIQSFVIFAVCAVIGFTAYQAGQKSGRAEGFTAGVEYREKDVVRQCDSNFPLHVGDRAFTCVRLK